MKDILMMYKNYLYALQWAKEFGNKYGDEEAVKMYERQLRKAKEENEDKN